MYAAWLVAPVPMIANWDPIANSCGMSGRYFSMIFIRFLGRFVSHLTRFLGQSSAPARNHHSLQLHLPEHFSPGKGNRLHWVFGVWILAYLVSLSNSNRNSMDFLHKRKMPVASVVYILKKNLQILKLTLPDVIFPTAGGNFWKCPSPHQLVLQDVTIGLHQLCNTNLYSQQQWRSWDGGKKSVGNFRRLYRGHIWSYCITNPNNTRWTANPPKLP